jgi:hypothetical protein
MVALVPTKTIKIRVREDHLPYVRRFAKHAGMTTSAWVRKMVEHELCHRVGLAAIREWEAADGPLTEGERAAARAELAAASAKIRANSGVVG